MKKRILIITLSVIGAIVLLIAIGFGVLSLSGNTVTTARCVVTDAGSLYMVYDERPVKLNYGKDIDCQTGDELLIIHSTAFAESYPEQCRTVFVMKIGNGTEADIPQTVFDVFDSLKVENNDSIPTKEQLVADYNSKGKSCVMELVAEYTFDDLTDAWEECEEFYGMYGGTWQVDGTYEIVVYYDGATGKITDIWVAEKEQELIAGPYYSASIPELTLTYGSESYKAMKGTLTWTYDKGDGTFETINADSMHPTAALAQMPKINIADDDPNAETKIILLTFDILPSNVKTLAWRVEDWGGADIAYEPAEVKALERGDGRQFRLELKDNFEVYEITATWNGEDGTGGTVTYCFRVGEYLEMYQNSDD